MRVRPPERIAVIDIGSNSARVVAFERDRAGHLRIRAGTRAALRLVHDVDSQRRLSEESMARALDALRDFRAIALGAGARRIVAVATAAIRDAENGARFIRRVHRELGIRVEIIDGEREARYGFWGAVRGLAVGSGLLFDMGGGSMQVTRFRRRRLERDWSLPLGALRLSEAFLGSDPPRKPEIRALREHVRRCLERAGVPRLRRGETLVGTGGTLRNLAKVDLRAHGYPIARLHAYELSATRLKETARRIAALPLRKRDSVPGLSDERADSIAGGALGLLALVDYVGAETILVSGEGVREGVAYSILRGGVPPAQTVRTESIASLTARFTDWRAETAARRVGVALALRRALMRSAAAELTEAIEHAARILDIGRSVDFFDRHEHAAEIVLATELDGFTHRQIALLAALMRRAGNPKANPRVLEPLLGRGDRRRIEQGAVLLALADDIEERCLRGARLRVACRVRRGEWTVTVPALVGWRPRALGERFERAFGKRLRVRSR